MKSDNPNAIRDRKDSRQQITPGAVDTATIDLIKEINRRLTQYGHGTYASRHEVLGVVLEEVKELTDAVHGSPLSAADRHLVIKQKYAAEHMSNGNTVRAELLDIAVACLFSVACIDEDGLAW